MKKLLIVLLLIIPISVSARSKTSCDYKLVSNLKKLASNVNITYIYKIIDDNVYYDVTIANLQENMYFVENNYGKTYYYSDTNDGIITLNDYTPGSFNFSFFSNDEKCLNEKLIVKNINLPFYNKFYHYDECKGIENYKLCQRWFNYNGTYENFVNNVNEYKQKLNSKDVEIIQNKNNGFFTDIITFYLNNFYILIPATIFIVLGFIYLFKYIKNKNNRFDI